MRCIVALTAVVVLSAACSDDADTGFVLDTGDPIWIPTEQTQVGMEALGTFNLQFDPELNCLYHDEPSNNGEPGTGGRIIVIWPEGYSAVRTPDGAFVADASGTPVAATDSPFQIGGGAIEVPGEHCEAIGAWLANGAPLPS